MKLETYLKEHSINGSKLAAAIGVGRASANRFIRGLRIPNEEVMARIYVFTNGKVTPNDFYELPVKKPKKSKPN